MDLEIGGQKITVRGLTRGEIKKLREEKRFEVQNLVLLEGEEHEDALDAIFELACDGLDADEITPGQALDIYSAVIGLTYAGGKERKKSGPRSGSSSEGESSTAESAGEPSSSPNDIAPSSDETSG